MMTALVLFIITVSNCRKDRGDLYRPLPDVPSFHNDIVPMFNSYCALSGCHEGGSPAGNLNLTAGVAYNQLFLRHEIDTITPANSNLYQRMSGSGFIMPPTGKLNHYYYDLVLKWIQQKAKNN